MASLSSGVGDKQTKRTCLSCQAEFVIPLWKESRKYCSRHCFYVSPLVRRNQKKLGVRICPECGVTFECVVYSRKTYCSKRCSAIVTSRIHRDRAGVKETHVCPKCMVEFPRTLVYFHHQAGRGDGMRSWCKGCHRADVRKWNQDHPRIRVYSGRQRVAAVLRATAWRHRNPRERLALQAAYRQRHRSRIRIDGRERYHWHRLINITEILVEQDWKCYYCSVELEDTFDLDHKIPKSRGGADSQDNTCIACVRCNRSKRDRTDAEFMGQSRIVAYG